MATTIPLEPTAKPSAVSDSTPRDASSPFRVGIIGGGQISEQHLASLADLKNVNVVGVCDLSPSLARFTAERFGIENWYTDYHEMLASGGCDVVHVLTPPATHDRIARDCIVAGCDVFVEKPVALCHDDFISLWSFAQEHGRRLVENQNYRFNGPIVRLRDAVTSGCLGTVEEIEVRMCLPIRGGGRLADKNAPHPSHLLPAGALHEFITHLSYLFLEFLPNRSVQDIDSVHAAWRNLGEADVFKYDDLDAYIHAGPIRGRIRFSARQSPDVFAVQVRGSNGCAQAELFQPSWQIVLNRPVGKHLTPLVNSLIQAARWTRAGVGNIWRKVRNRTAYEGLDSGLRQTYQAWSQGEESPMGFHEMNEAIQLIDAMLSKENQI